MYDTINRILEPISDDVINIVTLSTWQYAANTKQTKSQQKKTETRLQLVNCSVIPKVCITQISTLAQHAPKFHLSYAIFVRKSKNVMITLQKYQENPLKISFCFQTGDTIVIYRSTRGRWDCTTLQHHCTTFGLASHSQKSWVILLMNIHKPNRVIYDVSK